MSGITEAVAAAEDPAVVAETPEALWRGAGQRRALWALSIALLAAVAIYWATYASIVEIWLRSETFLHGFLIVPISAFLIWRRRSVLRLVEMKPFLPGLLAVFAVSAAWWIADVLGIQVGKQFMAVALLPALVLTIGGSAFARQIAFPLGYLVFAVPFGEAAIPQLIDFTAFFTVEALQMSGIPVLRDGAFFSLPTGDFEVAKACSGIRYVLASLAIGTLYGYLVYRNPRKRLGFFLFALLLPIVANGLRAFGIVLLAHFSNMKIAVGVDHLIYGWIFFGIVMLLMFWIGDRFRDEELRAGEAAVAQVPLRPVRYASAAIYAGVAAATIVLLAGGPALARISSQLELAAGSVGVPQRAGSWHAAGLPNDWEPDYVGATAKITVSYRNGERRVDLGVVRYSGQQQGAELASAVNAIADPLEWRFGQVVDGQVDVEGLRPLEFRETQIHQGRTTRLVWSWNEVNGEPVVGEIETKLREAASLLTLQAPDSAALIVSTPVNSNLQDARSTLESFMRSSLRAVRDCLYRPMDSKSACVDHVEAAVQEPVESAGGNR